MTSINIAIVNPTNLELAIGSGGDPFLYMSSPENEITVGVHHMNPQKLEALARRIMAWLEADAAKHQQTAS